ncbi:GumC family protein [Pararhodobacter zhoushanensis]|uniref:GumC family protein n=1 Tax=Pararhodobacter zhoushanensis TaxID=2479545 RepID=UPI000F8DB0AD|nr:Wzz/FepE/Etk N-terminal domain-containing protein [Pararhodobacter zhoushanensis]
MGPIQNLHEILSWIRRRWRIVVLLTVMGTVAGLYMALKTERVYSASAVIQVINPVIIAPTEGGAAAATPDLTRRVQVIEQRLMSREALLDLAQRYNLFDGAPLGPVEQVGILRANLSITSIAAAQQGFTRDGSLSALIVSAQDDDPETAAAIANELADSMVQQSLDARQTNAQQALDFFRSEEQRLETGIQALENEIARFRSDNEGFLPDAVTQRRDEQARLQENLLALRALISAKRAEIAAQDSSSTRAITRRQIAQLTEELSQLTDQQDIMTARIAEIQALLIRAPEFEQQVIAMNRRMEQLQAQLTAAADRRREAELGARIEDDQQAERFELLERALVPQYPVSRSRKKVAVMGVAGGIFLGILLAYALEWMNPVIRTAQRMERDLQLRPVVSIPYSMPVRERRRRQMIWAFGGLVVIGVGLIAALVYSGMI